MRTPSKQGSALLLPLLLWGATGCAQPEYLGNTSKGFWSNEYAAVSPNDAYRDAMPHLEETWKARCDSVRDHDEWCDKPPLDHMVQKGEYYYLTRTSYPYENDSAYLKYAVKVNTTTGEVIPLK